MVRPALPHWIAPWRWQLTATGIAVLMIAAALGLTSLYAGLAVYKAYDYTTTPDQNFGDATPASIGMPYESVSFPSRSSDRVTLRGWWIDNHTGGRTAILVHGRYQNRTAMMPLAKQLWEQGYSVLLFDLRGHGMSTAAPCSYGLREKWDVLGAVDFVKFRRTNATSIGIIGWSLGAASALMAMEFEPGLVVVSDSAYADSSSLLARNGLRPGLKVALNLVRGVDLDQVRPGRAVGRAATGSVFLIHGENDRAVPASHLERIQQAGGERVAETWLVHGAGHIGSYASMPDEYVNRVKRFFDAALSIG